ncbi:MAG: glycosyl hydrolase family 18 protein [Bacilli bacterium]|nr:glycosyl hydrolase family 18 protein [Bacilli bacterium]
MSNTGVFTKPYHDTAITLTATISYGEDSTTKDYTFNVESDFKDLSQGIIAEYLYTSISSTSDYTFEQANILFVAFGAASATGTISNASSIGSTITTDVVTKAHNNGTRVLLSINGASNLSAIAADATLRTTFANNIVSFINTYGIDGIDIDWEFPSSAEATNFTLLMKEIYEKVKANNPYHLVTAATGIDTYVRYDLENSVQYLDYVNIMTYDMQSSTTATNHSALYYKSGHCYKAISNAYTYYVTNLGLNANKLILGIPFYGKTFTNTNGLGTSATYSGSITYSLIVSTYLSNANYTEYWDSDCQVPYLYSAVDRTFITFDNPTSISLKIQYAASKGFAGIMSWQDGQDSNDILFSAMVEGMNDKRISFSANIGLLGLLIQGNKSTVLHKDVNFGGSITNEVYGSVNLYSTNSISINTSKKMADGDLGSDKTYGLMDSLEFITIHDTGNTSTTSSALANTNYMLDTPNVSWHYTVGDSSIYQNMSEAYTAYHAGSGARVFALQDTGIDASYYGNNTPIITFDNNGYYAINGISTTLRPYSDVSGTTKDSTKYTTSQITEFGIYWAIGANGHYYLNKTYYNSTYAKVCNFGGNTNSIGIETTVNNGSDIYQTWQNTAKLVADILVRNNLTPNEVLSHNAFSGKDCPHTLLNANLFDEFINMVIMEYNIRKYYSDYTIVFESMSPDVIDNDGRVIVPITNDTTVYYKITISKEDISESVILSSIIPA